MGKKYIVKIEDNETLYKTMIADGKSYMAVVYGEPYAEDSAYAHGYTEAESKYREIRDELEKQAYEKGVQDTKQHWVDAPRTCAYKLGYENGLNDAWEAARTLWNTPNRKEIFGHTIFNTVLTTLTAQEVIEEIRAYEQAQKEKEEQEEKDSVTAEEVMRQYLDRFCKSSRCGECVLHTSDFTCGRGHHFLTKSRVSDEEVRRAYATVLAKMKE